MVRINLIDPEALTDQHLVAEYDEILMLLGYVRRHPAIAEIPRNYTLGKGHILFFKDKLLYIKQRHDSLKVEMHHRGFTTRKTVVLREFPKNLCNDWNPASKDFAIIKKRIIDRIKLKPEFYRYYGKKRGLLFLIALIKKAKKY